VDSELFGGLVIWVNLALAGATALLFSIALVARLRSSWEQVLRDRIRTTWRPIMAGWIAGGHEPVAPLHSWSEWIEWIRLWNTFHENVRGEPQQLLNRLAMEVGLPARLHHLLSGSGESQLLAVIAAGNMRCYGYWKSLLPLVTHRNAAVSISASEALAKIDPKDALQKITPLIVQRVDWTLPRVATVLKHMGQPEVCNQTVKMLAEFPESRLPGLLRLIGTLKCENASEPVWDLVLAHDDPDIVAPALGLLRDPKSVGVIYGFLLHENWVIRMSAAACLGRVIGSDQVDFLIPILSDPVFWVRYHAAQAIANALGNSPDRIGTILAAQSDHFARDMLGQVIAEIKAA